MKVERDAELRLFKCLDIPDQVINDIFTLNVFIDLVPSVPFDQAAFFTSGTWKTLARNQQYKALEYYYINRDASVELDFVDDLKIENFLDFLDVVIESRGQPGLSMNGEISYLLEEEEVEEEEEEDVNEDSEHSAQSDKNSDPQKLSSTSSESTPKDKNNLRFSASDDPGSPEVIRTLSSSSDDDSEKRDKILTLSETSEDEEHNWCGPEILKDEGDSVLMDAMMNYANNDSSDPEESSSSSSESDPLMKLSTSSTVSEKHEEPLSSGVNAEEEEKPEASHKDEEEEKPEASHKDEEEEKSSSSSSSDHEKAEEVPCLDRDADVELDEEQAPSFENYHFNSAEIEFWIDYLTISATVAAQAQSIGAVKNIVMRKHRKHRNCAASALNITVDDEDVKVAEEVPEDAKKEEEDESSDSMKSESSTSVSEVQRSITDDLAPLKPMEMGDSELMNNNTAISTSSDFGNSSDEERMLGLDQISLDSSHIHVHPATDENWKDKNFPTNSEMINQYKQLENIDLPELENVSMLASEAQLSDEKKRTVKSKGKKKTTQKIKPKEKKIDNFIDFGLDDDEEVVAPVSKPPRTPLSPSAKKPKETPKKQTKTKKVTKVRRIVQKKGSPVKVSNVTGEELAKIKEILHGTTTKGPERKKATKKKVVTKRAVNIRDTSEEMVSVFDNIANISSIADQSSNTDATKDEPSASGSVLEWKEPDHDSSTSRYSGIYSSGSYYPSYYSDDPEDEKEKKRPKAKAEQPPAKTTTTKKTIMKPMKKLVTKKKTPKAKKRAKPATPADASNTSTETPTITPKAKPSKKTTADGTETPIPVKRKLTKKSTKAVSESSAAGSVKPATTKRKVEGKASPKPSKKKGTKLEDIPVVSSKTKAKKKAK